MREQYDGTLLSTAYHGLESPPACHFPKFVLPALDAAGGALNGQRNFTWAPLTRLFYFSTSTVLRLPLSQSRWFFHTKKAGEIEPLEELFHNFKTIAAKQI